MQLLRHPTLNRRSLDPIGWRVRDAVSPWFSHGGCRWWGLLLCEEGLAALQWPTWNFITTNVRLGVVAGVGGVTPRVRGDAWPLEPPLQGASSRAMLFPRSDIDRLVFIRRRWVASELTVCAPTGEKYRFQAADPEAFLGYPRKLQGFGAVVKTGRWPAG